VTGSGGWTAIPRCTPERQGRKLEELATTWPDREELAVCHGDLCVPNVLLDPDTLDLLGEFT
jgi:aminoglycoside phosphotransferase